MSIVDFHNHMLPGVDDAASSGEEAAAALRELLAQDTRQITATPHVNGSLTLRRDAIEVRLRGRWAALARRGREYLVGSQRRPPERAAGGWRSSAARA